ncbi:hypothetical protein [Methylococcus sp. EFPC2]|uniref:hypothetical protein n=1 Tax=Methylococcus sp. EFPC2 TaxID=2812648 RepID=UPI001F07DB03|nr:hypothetical protein [Methylococcus sp. EFPC2]
MDPEDWDKIDQDDMLTIGEVRSAIRQGNRVQLSKRSKDQTYETLHRLSEWQIEMVLAGSLINLVGSRGITNR